MTEQGMIAWVRTQTGWNFFRAQHAVDYMQAYQPEWWTPSGALDYKLFAANQDAIARDWMAAHG